MRRVRIIPCDRCGSELHLGGALSKVQADLEAGRRGFRRWMQTTKVYCEACRWDIDNAPIDLSDAGRS